MEDREEAYRYWLHSIEKIGDRAKRNLMDHFKSAKEIYFAPENYLMQIVSSRQAEKIREWAVKWQVSAEYEKLLDQKIHMVSIWDEKYPERLRVIKSPPLILYYLGHLPDEEKNALAIIGARECSDYGSFTAKSFGARAGEAGLNIISGMARGIDGIGQRAALDAGGYTFAVLGCGVDICYPASNRELYDVIQEKGGIISPFLPGTKPQKTLFPYRNRIVAGLSDAVLVIEARLKSGTWITVDMALEQGKDVYAVPGRLTDRLSDGCNLLIRQGAGIALTPEDIIAELAVLKNRRGKEGTAEENRKPKRTGREDLQKKTKEGEEDFQELSGLIGCLDLVPKSTDEILEQAKNAGMELTFSQLFFELIRLCMEGKAKQIGGSYFVRKLD